ncbi:hypothetical protein WCE41_02585 [Luteimonas sp. MJ246]|uniref:hypothetical protein n=1 Tax=Luteimonas sp. MJ174 TaxID=3129237 RepID=UPI0031B9D835
MNQDKDSRQPEHREQDDQRQRPQDMPSEPAPKAGFDREVGDLEDPEAEDDGALPGRAGGGLAGG